MMTAVVEETRARVLIVEDELLVAEDIRDTLSRLGYDVADVVASGEDALVAVKLQRPDLALMDIRLRGRMDGIDTAGLLRERYDVPVVYLTAHSDPATLQRAQRTEPFGYVIKPFQEKEIRATVAMALYRASMERRLRESEELHRLLVNHIPALICRIDALERYTFVNDAHEAWFGTPARDILGTPIRESLSADEYASVGPQLRRALKGEVVTFDASLRGGRRVQVTFVPGLEPFVYGVFVDVTERTQLEQALSMEKDRLFATLCSIGDGVIAVDRHGCVEFMNYVSERLTGWTSAEARGLPARQVLHLVDERSREPIWAPFAAALERGEITALPPRTLLLSRDGLEYPVEDSLSPVRDRAEAVTGAVIVFRDVTEERRIRLQIEQQARQDPLTGLSNRSVFEAEAQRLLDVSFGDEVHSLIYLDLDQFKMVNDTSGHAAGDELLRQVAQAMEQRLRKSDILARLGGDEFGILMRACAPMRAATIVQGIIDSLIAFPFTWQDKTFSIGASAGIAALDRMTDSIKDALVNADTACYLAKEKGRGRTQVFEPGNAVFAGRREQTTWASRILRALEQDALILFEQPIRPLLDASTSGGPLVEVLVRLVDEQNGIVMPMAFLPSAERYGLMPRIDRWVVRRLFSRVAAGTPSRRARTFSVNLSGASLSDDGMAEFILGEFERTGVDPSSVVFEITESVAVSNLTHTRKLMGTLRAVGCRFALDDFGRGVSSFNYLKELPVDFLKIDGSLVRGIAEDAVNHVMVEAINRIGHVMGIATVAEWVEDMDTVRHLRRLGVDYGQGFHLGRPTPMDPVGPPVA